MLRLLERAIVTFRIVVFEDGEINIAKLIFPFFQLFAYLKLPVLQLFGPRAFLVLCYQHNLLEQPFSHLYSFD